MRGNDGGQRATYSYILPEQRIPKDHPLRSIRKMADRAFQKLSPRFDEIYARIGRPSIPPERLLRALLLQVLYSVRSERLLMEQLDYNILFRWFVGLEMDDEVWAPTVFSKNRDRLLDGDIAQLFFEEVVRQAREGGLLSDEHFTVDGTMIEAWASQKSFRPKDGGESGSSKSGREERDFRGERRSNETHESTSDPQARLYRRTHHGEAKMAYLGHVLMDNRHGLAVGGCITEANGFAEREAAIQLIEAVPGGRITLGADKGYDTRGFVKELRENDVSPHVAQNTSNRSSAIDARTTRHHGYRMSQARRVAIERIPAWLKTIGLMRKTRHRGKDRVGWMFVFTLAAYNLIRLRGLSVAAT